ncbi:hypothetical protein LOZ55_005740 [Ophidiomyces ophidiicola]|nr:hypothetical protein LOZ55_005740 [Ophidiomyces ophidiicola]
MHPDLVQGVRPIKAVGQLSNVITIGSTSVDSFVRKRMNSKENTAGGPCADMHRSTSTVIRIPSIIPPNFLQKLCVHYRKARLRALQTDPSAFSSTYEREVQFQDNDWIKRLLNPLAQSFVALVKSDNLSPAGNSIWDESDKSSKSGVDHDHLKLLSENEWAGMIVLMGPKVLAVDGSESGNPLNAFHSMGAAEAPDAVSFAGRELAYIAASMFVLPEARRQGIGRRLIAESWQAVKKDAMALSALKLNICLLVAGENEPAIQLYRTCGFDIIPGNLGLENKSTTLAMVKMTEL